MGESKKKYKKILKNPLDTVKCPLQGEILPGGEALPWNYATERVQNVNFLPRIGKWITKWYQERHCYILKGDFFFRERPHNPYKARISKILIYPKSQNCTPIHRTCLELILQGKAQTTFQAPCEALICKGWWRFKETGSVRWPSSKKQMLSHKPSDQDSIPGIHIKMEGEKPFILWHPHMRDSLHAPHPTSI